MVTLNSLLNSYGFWWRLQGQQIKLYNLSMMLQNLATIFLFSQKCSFSPFHHIGKVLVYIWINRTKVCETDPEVLAHFLPAALADCKVLAQIAHAAIPNRVDIELASPSGKLASCLGMKRPVNVWKI